MANKHVAPEPPETWRHRLRDAIAPRTLMLAGGVLLLQFAFILSYLGAFHSPVPHQIPVLVVAPDQTATQLVDRANAAEGEPLAAGVAADEQSARAALLRGDTSAVYLVDQAGGTDTLLVASGGGTSVASAVQQIVTTVAAQEQRSVTTQDVVPLQPGDGRGLTGFYLIIGWAVGGYLFAAMLGVAKGERPATPPRMWWRLGATVPYAAISGVGGALIAGPLLHAFDGHFAAIAGVGTLVALSAATVTVAFQTLFGSLGIGLTVLVFVVLGNPSAGGAYQASLLPPFWRTVGTTLPNGAGTEAIRRIVYFDGYGVGAHLAVLGGWTLGGALLAIAATIGRAAVSERRRASRRAALHAETQAETAGGAEAASQAGAAAHAHAANHAEAHA